MKEQCEIVEDLLPLHVDGMLKTKTEEYVKEHLNHCDRCKRHKNDLWKNQIWKTDVTVTGPHSFSSEEEMEFVRRIKSWKRKTSIAGILLIILFSAVSLFLGKTLQEEEPKPVIKPAPAVEQQTSMILDIARE